jgi:hypothetical protein
MLTSEGADVMEWSKIEGSGSVPSVRAFHTSILNEANTSLLIYGGCNRDDVPYGDLYRFDIGTHDHCRLLNLQDVFWADI